MIQRRIRKLFKCCVNVFRSVAYGDRLFEDQDDSSWKVTKLFLSPGEIVKSFNVDILLSQVILTSDCLSPMLISDWFRRWKFWTVRLLPLFLEISPMRQFYKGIIPQQITLKIWFLLT